MADVERTDATDTATSSGDMPARSDESSTPERTDDPSRSGSGGSDGRLLDPDELSSYRENWEAVQARFVDHPEDAVKDADEIVGKLIQRLSDIFDGQRASLEARWQGDSDANTEDLRVTMQKYRSFLDRLLAA
jgi:hypothetical protein